MKSSSAMNQPLREKLEAWRAQKSQGQARESPPTECADKTAPRSWYRSVPTARRNNLILKPSDPAKVGAKSCSSKMFSKKDPKDIHCNAENVEQNVPASICHPKRESIAKEDKISEKDIIIKKLREENEELAFKLKETTNNLKVAVTRGRLAMEEVAAVNFQNDILQQENLELDCKISSERMDVNENASEKSRKHKLELEKLQREKDQYEKRADDMILQMNEQMTQLQTVAMDRIQVFRMNIALLLCSSDSCLSHRTWSSS